MQSRTNILGPRRTSRFRLGSIGAAVLLVFAGLAATGHTPSAVADSTPAAATPTVPDVGHFKITRTAPTLINGARVTTGTNNFDFMQDVAFLGTDLYVSSVYAKEKPANYHLRITRMGSKGNIISAMTLEGFNFHGALIGMEKSGGHVYVWLDRVVECSGCGNTDRIYRVEYSPGKTITPTSPQAQDRTPPEAISSTSYNRFPEAIIDVVSNRLVLKYRTEATGSRVNLAAYKLSDADAGKWTNADGTSRRVYKSTIDNPSSVGNRTYQTMTVAGSYAYFIDGVATSHSQPANCAPSSTTPGDTCVSVVNINTGSLVQRQKIDTLGSLTYREPEAIAVRMESGYPTLVYGFVSPSTFPHRIYLAKQSYSTFQLAWPTVDSGDSGYRVTVVQDLLRSRGYSLKATGTFDTATKKAVVAFQKAHGGLADDGIVGKETWAALIKTVEKGNTGDQVRALQVALNAHAAGLTVDGSCGTATYQAIRSFQAAQNLHVDGVAGAQTWSELV